MKIYLPSKVLFAALDKLIPIVAKVGYLPILEYFKFDAIDGRVTITATNNTVATSVYIEGNIVLEVGAICLPARLLYDKLKALKPQMVCIETYMKIVQKINYVVDDDGETSSVPYEVSTLLAKMTALDCVFGFEPYDAADFIVQKDLKKPKTLSVSLFGFMRQFPKVMPFVDLNAETPCSNVLMETTKDNLSMIATNREILIQSSLVCPNKYKPTALLIPKLGLQQVFRVATLCSYVSQFEISYDKKQIIFYIGDCTVSIRLFDDKYPDWRCVVDYEMPIIVTLNRDSLLQALSEIQKQDKRIVNVKLTFGDSDSKNKLGILGEYCEEDDFSSIYKIVDFVAKEAMKQFVINFKLQNLITCLAAANNKTITLEMKAYNRAILIKTTPTVVGNTMILIMPICPQC